MPRGKRAGARGDANKPPHSDAGETQRARRVGEAIRHALADILPNAHFRDPALAEISLTVTEARASPDLRNVTVFVLPLAGKAAQPIIAALNRAAPWLRGEVTRVLRLKFAPNLRFVADESFDTSDRVSRLLRDPRVRRDIEPADDND
jgi:ribosome-binding factor A